MPPRLRWTFAARRRLGGGGAVGLLLAVEVGSGLVVESLDTFAEVLYFT